MAAKQKRIKVRAVKLGFDGKRRVRPGEVFFVEGEEHVSKLWMEKVPEKGPEPKIEEKKSEEAKPKSGGARKSVI